jgi:prevent-host-death family protein
MSAPRYGLEQARAQLPHIAAEAGAGHVSVITRHGKAIAVVVPVDQWQQQMERRRGSSLMSLRGTGKGLWKGGAAKAVAVLRDEWEE